MDILKEGSNGADVTRAQQFLSAKGFSPGLIDGDFGPGTEAAVLAFQRSSGLAATGVVDRQTAIALGFDLADVPAATVMPNFTVAIVSKMFPFTQLNNISNNLPKVILALNNAGLTDVPIVLAALGTIRAETESFVPISEGISRFNTSPNGHPFDLYDFRRDLGNQGPPDGTSFKGRGFVQLTGRVNYQKFGGVLKIDLVGTPDAANDPAVASQILASFISSKRKQIENALQNGDFSAARRLVNGGSNGLDRFESAYKIGSGLLKS